MSLFVFINVIVLFREHAAITGMFTYKSSKLRMLGGVILEEQRTWPFSVTICPKEVRQDVGIGHLLHFCYAEGKHCYRIIVN